MPLDIPDADELLESAHVVALPMHVRFRGITVREALVTRGPAGWTEFSPFVEYSDTEAAAWLRGTIDYGWTQRDPLSDTVPVNATVPAVPADQVDAVLARFPGCTTAKVKVAEPGTTLADDAARVAAVRRALGEHGVLRIDANGLWSVDAAEEAVTTLARYRLDYVEQPCATVPELAELRTRIHGSAVRIAADESVRKAADPLAVARAGAADVVIIKAQPLGGITTASAVVAEAGLAAVVSSALETSIGISMGAYLAATVTDGVACGLGTAAMFTGDVTAAPLLPDHGRIPARRVSADPELLDRFAASPERRAWWFARLRRTHALLAA